jgi:hypothetical protein
VVGLPLRIVFDTGATLAGSYLESLWNSLLRRKLILLQRTD